CLFFFSSRRRHTSFSRDWSSDVCSSDLAVVVPVCLIGAFVAMYLLGFSLNNLSLMALIVAIALLADDAIIVVENISRHIDAGMRSEERRVGKECRARASPDRSAKNGRGT